jgi:hypothetical protein
VNEEEEQRLKTKIVLIAVIATLLVVFATSYMRVASRPRPHGPNIGNLTGDPKILDECNKLVSQCQDAIKAMNDCSIFLDVITLGNWCQDETANAIGLCTAADHMCRIAK